MLSKRTSNKIANMSLVCAVLVVFIHIAQPTAEQSVCWYVWRFIRDVLASVAVPYFFIISGFMLARHFGEPGWWKVALSKRLKSLGIPYLAWNAVMMVVVLFALPLINQRPVEVSWGSVLSSFGLDLFREPADRPLWYIRMLFILVFASPVISWTVKKFVFYSRTIWHSYCGLADGLERCGAALLEVRIFHLRIIVFSVGIYLQLFGGVKVSLPFAVAMLFVGVLFGIWGILGGGLVGVSIPFMLLFLWKVIPSMSWPREIVASAFAIYVGHSFFIVLANGVARHFSLPIGSALGMGIEWLLAAALPCAFAMVVKRRTPRLSVILYGGRV